MKKRENMKFREKLEKAHSTWKKAQVIAQPMIYMMALLGFSLILFFGYKAVKGLSGDVETAQEASVFSELKTAVERVKVNYGSVRKFELNLPKKYSEICFVDIGGFKGCIEATDTCVTRHLGSIEKRQFIADTIQGGSKQNVFLKPPSQAEIILKDVEVDNGQGCGIASTPCDKNNILLCFNNTGVIPLNLEGLGKSVKISKW